MSEENTAQEIRPIEEIDKIEAAMMEFPSVEMPLVHLFTPGLYLRQITMPAGTLLTSMKHLTEHPFFVLSGEIEVRSETENIKYCGPCMGVTLPGTKRLLYAITDTVWVTVHANPDNLDSHEKLAERILDPTDNPLIASENFERANAWRNSPQTTINHLDKLPS